MQVFFRHTAAFIAAVVLTGLLSSVFSSQFVISGLQSVGVEVPLTTRLVMTVKDLAIFQILGIATIACLLPGFLLAGLCHRFIGGNRKLWFVIAGASALITLLLVMSALMQLMPIAGARSNFGLFTQALAGASGGWLFARLTEK